MICRLLNSLIKNKIFHKTENFINDKGNKNP